MGFGIFECGGGDAGSQSVRFFGGSCSFRGSLTLLTHAVAEEGEAAEVVEQVAQADLQPGADFADAADEVGLITPALVPANRSGWIDSISRIPEALAVFSMSMWHEPENSTRASAQTRWR